MENFFPKLKPYRVIATRYDKRDRERSRWDLRNRISDLADLNFSSL